jgi:hypothetical protein
MKVRRMTALSVWVRHLALLVWEFLAERPQFLPVGRPIAIRLRIIADAIEPVVKA